MRRIELVRRDRACLPLPRLGMRAVFDVIARARHWMEFYGLRARAAVMKTCFIGCADASNTRTRRVLRTMAAPIFSSLVRIVPVQACASSVPFRPRRRRLIISV